MIHYKTFSTLIFLLFSACFLFGQSDGRIDGSHHLGIGGATAAIGGIDAMYSNQAGIVLIDDFSLDVSATRKFDLPELTTISVAAVSPSSIGHLGIIVSKYGLDEYSEQKIGLAYARKLTDKLFLGAQFDVFNYRIMEYGSETLFTFEAGLYSILTSGIHIGAHLFSPAKIGLDEGDNIPSGIALGGKFIMSPVLNMYVEVEKLADREEVFKAGFAYKLIEKFEIRAGFNTTLSSVSFGFGYEIDKTFKIEGATSYNTTLGMSPGVSLKYFR